MQRLFKIQWFAVSWNAMMFEDPSFCGMFCVILNNPMFCSVFNTSPLQNPMQQFSKTTCFASVSVQKCWNPVVLLCAECIKFWSLLCATFLRPSAFQKPRRKISRCKVSTGRSAARNMRGHGMCTLHWDSCIQRRCLLQLLLSWRRLL